MKLILQLKIICINLFPQKVVVVALKELFFQYRINCEAELIVENQDRCSGSSFDNESPALNYGDLTV
jgi:hypothetical protein